MSDSEAVGCEEEGAGAEEEEGVGSEIERASKSSSVRWRELAVVRGGRFGCITTHGEEHRPRRRA